MPIILYGDSFPFFLEKISAAVAAECTRVSALSHAYVAGVLQRHLRSDWHPDSTWIDRFSAADTIPLLQELGDMALVCSGLYPEFRQTRRGGGLAYQKALGRTAYCRIATDPFPELAQHFQCLVDALMRFSADHSDLLSTDILRWYEIWHQTHSPRIARLLAAQGIDVKEEDPSPRHN